MTRLGHGALKPKRAAVDLAEIVGTVRNDLARVLAGHRLIIELPKHLPPVDVDPVLIGQAVANVLENAAKYAPVGTTITIRAEPIGKDVRLSVTDEGSGIASDERDRVFDLFHRAARGDTAPAGTGMGLAIVKGLVEAHGGSVRAEAGPGNRGTTIFMILPLSISASSGDDGA